MLVNSTSNYSEPSNFPIFQLKSFVSIFMICFVIISCENSTEPVQSEHYNQVKNLVDSIRLDLEKQLGKEVPSMNLLISSPNEEIFVSSVPIWKNPLTKDTYFRFGSNSKTFTSAAILNMQEDGWLNINDKIIDLIPGTTIPYVPTTDSWEIPYKNQITIKQLLQHMAGVFDMGNERIPEWNNQNYTDYKKSSDPNHQFSVEEMVNQCTYLKLTYGAPGTNYNYSNTGYAILSEIIARVYSAHSTNSKTYSDYLYDYIVGGSSPVKLGLKFPYLASDNQLPAPYVPSTIYYEDNSIKIIDKSNSSAFVGEGNGYGTMEMLKTWIRTLMTENNVLNQNSINLLKTEKASANSGYSLGMGIFSDGNFYGHTGVSQGYLSAMFYEPKTDITMIMFIPMWDLTDPTYKNITISQNAMYSSAFLAKEILVH